MKRILLGEIVAAHGIKGHVKIKTYTENPVDIGSYGPMRDENDNSYTLSNIRQVSPHAIIAFIKGITDRNQAEALCGTKFYIDRAQLPEPTENEFYHEDLINISVYDEQGTHYGNVLALQDFGAGEFFDIKSSDQTKFMTLPFNEDAVLDINIEEKKMIINSEFLLV